MTATLESPTATAYRLQSPPGAVLVVVEQCRHALGPLRPGDIGRAVREHTLSCSAQRAGSA